MSDANQVNNLAPVSSSKVIELKSRREVPPRLLIHQHKVQITGADMRRMKKWISVLK